MTGKIIVIEGVDYTGKTTLARELTKRTGGVYYHSPSGQAGMVTEDLYGLLRGRQMQDGTKAAIMLATNIENITRMNELKAEGETVIADRSIFSMFAYQGLPIKETLTLFNVPQFDYDLVVHLDAKYHTILERHNARGADALDEYFIEHQKRIEWTYSENFHDYFDIKRRVLISTDHTTTEDVIKLLEPHLEKIGVRYVD